MTHLKKTTMRYISLILLGFVILILWLIVGYPFEISNLIFDRLLMILVSGLIIGLVFLIYRLLKRLKNKKVKIVFLISLIFVSLIYSWIGLWTYLISDNKGLVWEDRQIYTNPQGSKVISQFRETSGSIYDYRERFILYEFANGNRISIEWTESRMHGIWKVRDLKKDSICFENFDDKRKIKNANN
jgi:hypothetical protein